MLDKKRTKQLEDWMDKRKANPGRLIYIIYRYVHEWASVRWKADGWENLQPDHLRLISIVGTDSVNNNELAKRARVSKQAMSKMVMQLEKFGFIDVNPDPKDSRAKVISVNNQGADFLQYFNSCGMVLVDDFAEIIGEKKTKQLIPLLSELAEGLIERDKKRLEEEK